jgi:hypothetical protein
MSLRAPIGRKLYLPERYVTTFTNSLECYLSSTKSTATAGNYTNFVLNSIVYSFNAAYPVTLVPGATFAFNGNLVQGNTVTQGPIGYTNFVGLYEKYKVHKFRMTAVVIPANVADATSATLLPIGEEQIPSAAAGSVNTRVFEAQPSSVNKTCTPFCTGTPGSNTLVIEGYPWDYLGMRKEQYLDEAPDAIGVFPATPCYGGLFLQQLMGTANVAAISVRLTLEQVVELCDLVNPIN